MGNNEAAVKIVQALVVGAVIIAAMYISRM